MKTIAERKKLDLIQFEGYDFYAELETDQYHFYPGYFEAASHRLVRNVTKIIIEVSGDSMSPILNDGQAVLAQVVPPKQIETIDRGIYAVIGPESFLIRRIRRNELATRGVLWLWAEKSSVEMICLKRDQIWCLLHIQGIISPQPVV